MNEPVIARLQQRLVENLRTAHPDRTARYVILDFPNHSNVGDSAIYVGEERLLSEYFGRPPEFVTEAEASDLAHAESYREAFDTIFLHGGGNFGDLWPRHQRFREAVVRAFPDKKIIQLPQTIHFDDLHNADVSKEIFNAHPDLLLMVRDRASLKIAQSLYACPVLLTPDMAFMIGALVAPEPRVAVAALMREDRERGLLDRKALEQLDCSYIMFDWPSRAEERTLRMKIRDRLVPVVDGRPSAAHYKYLAKRRLTHGVKLIARGNVVLTDRLHAHILCLLLGKRHVVLDNSYGKISTFIDVWTGDGDFTRADDLADAVQKVQMLCAKRERPWYATRTANAIFMGAGILSVAALARRIARRS